ncbi:MAG TPA: hypothetical protein PLO24_04110 [Bacteroidales bacterium]|jgi:hypothetical protein|nr:hypothetical protein [Bacteroidales bacterium]HOS70838.1 hypothetical protein [Bacteroidales bacterium]HQH24455.1 hypothetical protein [Bacteroidales bacterium]HQJ81412.1 hypothetical protein [Bacteroidales bacterium]
MKKIYLCIAAAFILAASPSLAQFEKGSFITGVSSTFGVGSFGTDLMSIGTTSQKIKYNEEEVKGTLKGGKYFNLSLLPRAGYFVIDNLSVGLDLILGYNSWKYPEEGKNGVEKTTSTSVAAGPFVRYYYPLEKLYPFVQANVAFGIDKTKGYYSSTNLLSVYGIGVGAAKTIGEKVMVDAVLGWNSASLTDEDNDKEIYGSFGVRVGFSYFFSIK